MENERLMAFLSHFAEGHLVSDIKMRLKDFTNDEIEEAVKAEYIKYADTTPWGDKRFAINSKGLSYWRINGEESK